MNRNATDSRGRWRYRYRVWKYIDIDADRYAARLNLGMSLATFDVCGIGIVELDLPRRFAWMTCFSVLFLLPSASLGMLLATF